MFHFLTIHPGALWEHFLAPTMNAAMKKDTRARLAFQRSTSITVDDDLDTSDRSFSASFFHEGAAAPDGFEVEWIQQLPRDETVENRDPISWPPLPSLGDVEKGDAETIRDNEKQLGRDVGLWCRKRRWTIIAVGTLLMTISMAVFFVSNTQPRGSGNSDSLSLSTTTVSPQTGNIGDSTDTLSPATTPPGSGNGDSSAPPLSGSTIVLRSNQFLERGQFTYSSSGRFKVGLTADSGDLVLVMVISLEKDKQQQKDYSQAEEALLWSAGIKGGPGVFCRLMAT